MSDGKGHREADPPVVADLLPDGRAQAGHGAGDQTRRGGLQRHERRRVRAALLRGPLGARIAAHPADRRAADRRRGRAGELLAAPGELPPARDCLLRQGARCAADRAEPARRRIRLRRAAAPGAATDHLGAPEPAARARAAVGRARHHRLRRRARVLRAPGEGRDGDLPQQDDHLRLLHDGARRGRRAPRRPLPPAVPGRPVLPARLRPRAQGRARIPSLANPRKGLLRDEGRARFPPPGRLRPALLRQPRRLAAGRGAGRGRGADLRADRLAGRTPLRPLRRDPRARAGADRRRRGERGGQGLSDELLQPPQPDLVGTRARRARAAAGARGADRGARAARGSAGGAPRRDAAGPRTPPHHPRAGRQGSAGRYGDPHRRAPGRRPQRIGLVLLARGQRGRGERQRRLRGPRRRRHGDPPGALRAAGDAREHPDPGRPRGQRRAREASAG